MEEILKTLMKVDIEAKEVVESAEREKRGVLARVDMRRAELERRLTKEMSNAVKKAREASESDVENKIKDIKTDTERKMNALNGAFAENGDAWGDEVFAYVVNGGEFA